MEASGSRRKKEKEAGFGQGLVAFLETRGVPATQAAAKVTELFSKPGMQPGKFTIAKFLGQRLYNEYKRYQQQHAR